MGDPPSELLRVGGGRRRALLPGLDLINHKPGTKATLERASTDSGSVWRVVAHEPYRKDEEVFLSYGERDNLRLLLQYGFALANDAAAATIIFDVRRYREGLHTLHALTAVP